MDGELIEAWLGAGELLADRGCHPFRDNTSNYRYIPCDTITTDPVCWLWLIYTARLAEYAPLSGIARESLTPRMFARASNL